MKQINWNNVEESNDNFKRLVPGGYVVKITKVEDNAAKEYLSIVYDIVEGEYKGMFSDPFYIDKEYMHRMIRSYKEKALGMFKAFYKRVEETNTGFVFTGDETKFVGKGIGIVLSEEEYMSNSGEIKFRLYVSDVKTAGDIRSGNYKVRDLKKLAIQPVPANANGFMNVPDGLDDEELPF